jgi:fanconi-associated nuclease 1
MVLNSTHDVGQSSILGPKIGNQGSIEFHRSPPAKRLKTGESTDVEDSQGVSGNEAVLRTPDVYQDEVPDSEVGSDSDDAAALQLQQRTELESVSPPVKTDKEAIADYEAMRMVDQDVPEDLKARLGQTSWKKGKSSIYVDAFNLALETVLCDERHLFDEKEMEIFYQWRELEYEAKYL